MQTLSGVIIGAFEPLADGARSETAYRALLQWAAEHGSARKPTETTQQLRERLVEREPGVAEAVGLVTSTFEEERYGERPQPADRLGRVQAAVRELFGSM